MFHQVKVIEEDRDALRFLWWPNGNLNQDPKWYQMKVHLFGATSSPTCAVFALRCRATDNSDKFEREVNQQLEKNSMLMTY